MALLERSNTQINFRSCDCLGCLDSAAHPVSPFFQEVIAGFGLYLMKRLAKVEQNGLNRLWIALITSIFHGTPQKIQRRKIQA